MMKQRKKHNKEMEKETTATNEKAPQPENMVSDAETSQTQKNNTAGESDGRAAVELAEMKAKYEEANDKYLRLYSEFDNFRKRVLKEKIEMSKTASEQVVIDMLTVLDDFERAITAFDKADTIEPIREGTVLIYNKFKNNLTQKGLTEIEAMGQSFDTDFHEAIAHVPAVSDDQKGKVIDVTQKGYLLNGKVIRYSKVVVSK